jgi:hypothetical protein
MNQKRKEGDRNRRNRQKWVEVFPCGWLKEQNRSLGSASVRGEGTEVGPDNEHREKGGTI